MGIESVYDSFQLQFAGENSALLPRNLLKVKWSKKWIADNWRHDLTNTIIGAVVLGLLALCWAAAMKSSAQSPAWLWVLSGIIIGGLVGGGLWWLSKNGEDQPEAAAWIEQRPWIKIDVAIGGPLTRDAHGNIGILADVTLTNTGRSPAADVRVSMEFIPIFGDPRADQKRIGDAARNGSPNVTGFGEYIFPGSSSVRRYGVTLTKEALDAFEKKMMADFKADKNWDQNAFLLAGLLGCVDYKFTFEDGHHQTYFSYDLKVFDDKPPHRPLAPSMNNIPISESKLVLMESTGGFITIPAN